MKSLLSRFIFLFLTFVVLQSAVTFVFTYYLYEDALSQKNISANQQKLEQINSNLETLLSLVVAATNQLWLDYDISELLTQQNEDFFDWYKHKAKPVQERLASIQSGLLYRYDSSVLIFGLEGDCYGASIAYPGDVFNVAGQEWFQDAVSAGGYLIWLLSDNTFSFLQQSSNGIAVLRPIQTRYRMRTTGLILVTIELNDALQEVFQNEEAGQALMLIDSSGKTALSSNSEISALYDWNTVIGNRKSGSFDYQGEKTLYSINVSTVPLAGWRLVQVTDIQVVFHDNFILRQNFLLLSIGIVSIVTFLLVLVSRRIIRPLRDLSGMFKAVGSGNFSMAAPVRGEDEIAQISQSFNQMVSQIGELLERVNHEHALHEKAKLDALRAQITPHFLLNTLNDIRWMAVIDNDQKVASMLTTLGKLLESTLGRQDQFVSLNEELLYAQDYTKLQQMRFDDLFEIRFNVEQSILEVKVPPLILQPLIENTLTHGFSDMDCGGIIEIRAWPDDIFVYIEVSDNGKGLSYDKLTELQQAMDDLYTDTLHGIGLINVHRRLVLGYGNQYGLRINNRPGQGLSVTLILPLEVR